MFLYLSILSQVCVYVCVCVFSNKGARKDDVTFNHCVSVWVGRRGAGGGVGGFCNCYSLSSEVTFPT